MLENSGLNILYSAGIRSGTISPQRPLADASVAQNKTFCSVARCWTVRLFRGDWAQSCLDPFNTARSFNLSWTRERLLIKVKVRRRLMDKTTCLLTSTVCVCVCLTGFICM